MSRCSAGWMWALSARRSFEAYSSASPFCFKAIHRATLFKKAIAEYIEVQISERIATTRGTAQNCGWLEDSEDEDSEKNEDENSANADSEDEQNEDEGSGDEDSDGESNRGENGECHCYMRL